ncbi:MAG: SpoIIE family protein phosphatase [Kiritimatiellae bacterium]|nr:SpoIIE family protein phosphatase [Kiritimatiellia bacterium]
MSADSPAKKPLKALIIEDSETDALLLTEQLRAGGYDPQTRRVDNAEDLTEALQTRTWDIIYSDHNMPQFSSTEALEIVRSSAMDVPFIIVSGAIGEEAAVAAMKAGAQDYLMKGNLARLVAATARELHDAQERRARRAAERARLAQGEEFRRARELQQRLFPSGPPTLPEFDIAGASLPAAATGGDYFDFISTRSGELFVVVGDVTGHGVGPALLMADARAYLRALAVSDQRFEDILARVRTLMIEDLGLDHFITLFFAKLDPATGLWTYINAGHPPGYVLAPDGTVKAEMMPGTAALGIDREETPLEAAQLTLEKGDLLLLISDGIPEARNQAGEEFSEERVLQIVQRERSRSSAEIIQTLMDEARRFAQPEHLQDDMTAVVLKL